MGLKKGLKNFFITTAIKRWVKKNKESPMLKFLTGKKTYIIAILIAVGGILEAFGISIPTYVWPILGGLGFGAVRAGINKNNA